MFSRPVILTGVLAAAVAVPYVTMSDGLSSFARTQWSSLAGKPTGEQSASPASAPPLSTLAGEQPVAAAPVAPGPTITDFREVLRFDVSPEWVAARWPRVSTVLGETQHMGLRVPLITGVQPSDIAGSMTFYFDDRHRVQRLTFIGLTGDESRIIALACGHYGLKPTPSLEAGLYVAGNPNKPTSTLRLVHANVVRSDAQNARIQVALDLQREDVAWHTIRGERPPKILLPQTYRRW